MTAVPDRRQNPAAARSDWSPGPTVSVVIPTCGRPRRLQRTLATVFGQVGVELEVLLVQDGPDAEASTAGLVERTRDDRLRTVTLEGAVGMTAARNMGLARAHGQWVAFLDDDDLWSPNKLRDQLVAAGQDAAFVYSAVVIVDDRCRVIAAVPAPEPHLLLRQVLERNVIPATSSNLLVRRESLLQLDGFDESFRCIADWDASIRLAATFDAAADPNYAVAHVLHSGNWSLTRQDEHRAELRRLMAKHRDRTRSLGVGVDEAWFMRWLASGHRRSGQRLAAVRLYLEAAMRHRHPLDLARGLHAALGFPSPRRSLPAVPWLQSIAPASDWPASD